MDDLCSLMAGANINKQHPYFDMAKRDIYKLVMMYVNYQEYDSSQLILIQHIRNNRNTVDFYYLNIVIQYIITYGDELFKSYLKDHKIDSYNKYDYSQYLDEYVDELSSIIR